jgi:hypothetical protein
MYTSLVLAYEPFDCARQVPLSSTPKFYACAIGVAVMVPIAVRAAATTPLIRLTVRMLGSLTVRRVMLSKRGNFVFARVTIGGCDGS